MTALSQHILSFLRWWFHQLCLCVPERLKDAYNRSPRTLVVRISQDECTLQLRANRVWRGNVALKEQRDAPELGLSEQLAAIHRKYSPFLDGEIQVLERDCLKLERQLPENAREQASNIMMLEMERKTPFQRLDVYAGVWFQKIKSDLQSHTARQYIVRRSAVDDYLKAFSKANIPVSSITVVSEGEDVLPVNLLPAEKVSQKQLHQKLNYPICAFLILSFLGLAVLGGLKIHRQQQALDQLRQDVSVAQRKAVSARKKRDSIGKFASNISGLYRKKAEHVSILKLWEELTRVLPDTSWVTEVRLEKGLLFLNGYSRAASDLIAILSRSRLFDRAEFVAPVIRDPRTGMERFKIQLQLSSTKIAQGPVAQTALEKE